MRPTDVAGLAVLAALAIPPDRLRSGPVTCPFRRVTGRPCPTCGLSRSWNALAHLRLRESLFYHPLGPVTFIGAIWLAIAGRRGRLDRLPPDVERLVPVAVTAWLAVWVIRLLRGDLVER